ncbi:MAG: DNA polymerase III subunit gamma/tau [Anaerolineae bacterium]
MGQALYRKWRPQTFDDVVGQEHIVQTLRYALRTGHLHHAYLLAGPRGTGKTTTARLIAKAVNCLAPQEERPCNKCEICRAINEGRLMDLMEIDAASHTGVDNIRDLLEKVGFRPTQATYKVYVVDEVHMLSTSAFNALLKTLEEPPEHVIFILATTEVHKVPETILSRCQRYEFRRIPLKGIIQQLETIASAEGVEVEPEALELIARAATGSMRDAISLFDQLAAERSITADYVRLMLGAERREVVRSLLAAWVDRDLSEGLQVINQAIDGGADPRQLARQTADFLRGLLLMRLGAGHTWADPTAEEREVFAEMAARTDPDRLVEAVRRFSEVASAQRVGWQPQLPLELAFVEATLQGMGLPQPSQARPAAETTAAREGSKPAHAKSSSPAKSTAAHTEPAAERGAHRAQDSKEQETSPKASASSSAEGRQYEQPGQQPSAVSEQSPEMTDEAASTTTSETPSEASSEAVPQVTASEVDEQATAGNTTLDSAVVETIRANWSEILRRMQPVMLGALLRDAEVGGLDDEGRLVLVFQHAFHCEKVAELANLKKIEAFLEQAFKQQITLRCVIGRDWEPTNASRGSTSSKRNQSIPEEEDELIKRAHDELGAVVKIKE